jgi:leader peptidase (prepilin peptidase)/N-methyltransferase
VAVLLSLFVAALIVATFIDLEHLIIPDEITLGGAAGGLVAAVVAPGIHGQAYVWPALKAAAIGGGDRGGDRLGHGGDRGNCSSAGSASRSRPVHGSNSPRPTCTCPTGCCPTRTSSTAIPTRWSSMRTGWNSRDRCYRGVDVRLRLRLNQLTIGDESVDASTVKRMEATTDEVTVPREAMGFGDVKFMAAIGAFTGWEGVLFTLLGSSVAGLALNIILIAVGRRQWSARIPFGPYLAAAALAWVLGADGLFRRWIL